MKLHKFILLTFVLFIPVYPNFLNNSHVLKKLYSKNTERITIYECGKNRLIKALKNFNNHSTRSISNSSIKEIQKNDIRQLFIVNLKCKNSLKFLNMMDKLKFFSVPNKWIFFNSNDNNLLIKLKNLTILVDSEVLLINQMEINKIYKKHINDTKYTMEKIGTWQNLDDFNFIKEKNRKKLGITLNACIVLTNNDSINHLVDKRNKHIDSIAKVNYVLLLLMASIYDIKIKFSIKNTWGYKNNDSQWNGMMGELIRKNADIGATSLFLIKERVDLIDYIAMISPTRSKFVFRQPKLSYVTNVYTLPFTIWVWLSTIISIILMMFTIYFLIKWENFKKRFYLEKEIYEMNGELNFSDIIFLTFGAICQQSAYTLPYSTPGRVATFCLFLSLMFIYTSYSANIVALLQTSSNSIKTLEDLLKSRLSVGVDDTVFNHFFFTTTNEPIRKAIYETKVAPAGKPANFFKIDEGILKMRQGLFAFHMETGSGYKIIGDIFQEDEKCGLQEIQFLQVVDPWLAIQKNSAYKELFKIGLHLLRENGIQQRENNLIYTKKPPCVTKGSTFFSVGIIDCYPAALILIIGMFIAFLIFLIEIALIYLLNSKYYRIKKVRLRKN